MTIPDTSKKYVESSFIPIHFFCAMHSTNLQYYVLSKQYLTALTYYYDFNVYMKYVEKKYVYELWSCIRAVEGFLKVLTFTIGAERKLYA